MDDLTTPSFVTSKPWPTAWNASPPARCWPAIIRILGIGRPIRTALEKKDILDHQGTRTILAGPLVPALVGEPLLAQAQAPVHFVIPLLSAFYFGSVEHYRDRAA